TILVRDADIDHRRRIATSFCHCSSPCELHVFNGRERRTRAPIGIANCADSFGRGFTRIFFSCLIRVLISDEPQQAWHPTLPAPLVHHLRPAMPRMPWWCRPGRWCPEGRFLWRRAA